MSKEFFPSESRLAMARELARGRKPEARSYAPPWYEQAGNAITDFAYGPKANTRQNEFVQKLVGPQNPFNLPAQATQGYNTAAGGYRRKDVGSVLAGAAQIVAANPLWPAPKIAKTKGILGNGLKEKPVSILQEKMVDEGFDANTLWFHGSDRNDLKTIEVDRRDPGAWFTTYKQNAANYARGDEAMVYEANLRVRNPYVVEFRENEFGEMVPVHDGKELSFTDNVDIVNFARSKGYDAVHFPSGNFSEADNTIVVFDSDNIRLLE